MSDINKDDSTQILGDPPSRIAVTIGGRTSLVVLTRDEIERIQSSRAEHDEEICARILGERRAARLAVS